MLILMSSAHGHFVCFVVDKVKNRIVCGNFSSAKNRNFHPIILSTIISSEGTSPSMSQYNNSVCAK